MDEHDSIDLFARVREGESEAQFELFDHYVVRLLGLVRKRISPQFARRIEAEDVVQSAYRSFFSGVQDDRFVLQNSGDLWRLLAAITMNKLHRQLERNKAAKRSVNRECSIQLQLGDSSCTFSVDAVASEPTPEDEVALSEEIGLLMDSFDSAQQTMFELRLAGATIDEIATQMQCSERTVRRFFDQKVKPMLASRFGVPATS
ncbi:RNA polymerase sigma factor [Rosistilla carotiformis]|uniref:RNA polymerase sigma factor n=1 Tax=Rosistilla carotiformis TaxID=2528017 RepID=A0A518JNA7_9BACT|nr:ECF-type sigma factor [Rosistilla carotiformis]QDV67022.1 RNA polymerase sigma factor [Rosistilla carotiformis]